MRFLFSLLVSFQLQIVSATPAEDCDIYLRKLPAFAQLVARGLQERKLTAWDVEALIHAPDFYNPFAVSSHDNAALRRATAAALKTLKPAQVREARSGLLRLLGEHSRLGTLVAEATQNTALVVAPKFIRETAADGAFVSNTAWFRDAEGRDTMLAVDRQNQTIRFYRWPDAGVAYERPLPPLDSVTVLSVGEGKVRLAGTTPDNRLFVYDPVTDHTEYAPLEGENRIALFPGPGGDLIALASCTNAQSARRSFGSLRVFRLGEFVTPLLAKTFLSPLMVINTDADHAGTLLITATTLDSEALLFDPLRQSEPVMRVRVPNLRAQRPEFTAIKTSRGHYALALRHNIFKRPRIRVFLDDGSSFRLVGLFASTLPAWTETDDGRLLLAARSTEISVTSVLGHSVHGDEAVRIFEFEPGVWLNGLATLVALPAWPKFSLQSTDQPSEMLWQRSDQNLYLIEVGKMSVTSFRPLQGSKPVVTQTVSNQFATERNYTITSLGDHVLAAFPEGAGRLKIVDLSLADAVIDVQPGILRLNLSAWTLRDGRILLTGTTPGNAQFRFYSLVR